MGKKTPSAPAAPDPVATSTAQTASNKETAYWNAVLNNVNQTTPYGSITYTGGEGAYNPDKPPQFSSTITLSPEQQRLYDAQVGQQQQLSDLGGEQIARIRQNVSTPFSYGGIGNEVTAEGVAEAQKRAEEALMSRLSPQFGRDEEALRTRLINQGITQGSEAYNREFDSFNQKQNDARMQAILNAAQYGGTLQDQALQRRNQGIQEYTTQRNAPLNEYSAFTSGTQIQNPTFQNSNYQGAQAGDLQGAVNNAYQGQLGQYNSKVASRNALQSSLFGLGGTLGAAAIMSDIRLKYNIIPDGTDNGINMYKFSYLGDDAVYRGVMAQEVAQTHPEAVVMMPSGYMAVNYGMIGVSMEAV